MVRQPRDGEERREHEQHPGNSTPALHDPAAVARQRVVPLQRPTDDEVAAGERVRHDHHRAGDDVDEDEEEAVEYPTAVHRVPVLVAVGERVARRQDLERDRLHGEQRQHDRARDRPDQEDRVADVRLRREAARLDGM